VVIHALLLLLPITSTPSLPFPHEPPDALIVATSHGFHSANLLSMK